MLQEMKQQLIGSIKKAKESGELTAHHVYEITRDEVAENAQRLKADAKKMREISKESVTVTIQSLVEIEDAGEEKISAALHGVVDGAKQVELQVLDTTHKELTRAKKRLWEEAAKLAGGLNEAFDGAREAADNFTGEVKINIETALSDAKLKSTELFGLTRDTVKEAVSKTIETGTEVEKTVVNVTRNATVNALAETRFSAERVRKISETVLSAAVEAAEEQGSHISETSSAAVEGVRQGLTDIVGQTRKSIAKAGKSVKEFAVDDLEQTKEDLETVGDLFVETLRKVADSSGEVAGDMLHELADDAKKAGSVLREKAVAASHTVADQLKDLGSEMVLKTSEVGDKAAHALGEEAKELGARLLTVSKGAATGMWKGAKTAFYKDENKNVKS
ncbi:MAG: DUF6781 family protein [Pseudomonadota bacterium]|nr:DUF6781 family protein [Pseudomonadota bacterium]